MNAASDIQWRTTALFRRPVDDAWLRRRFFCNYPGSYFGHKHWCRKIIFRVARMTRRYFSGNDVQHVVNWYMAKYPPGPSQRRHLEELVYEYREGLFYAGPRAAPWQMHSLAIQMLHEYDRKPSGPYCPLPAARCFLCAAPTQGHVIGWRNPSSQWSPWRPLCRRELCRRIFGWYSRTIARGSRRKALQRAVAGHAAGGLFIVSAYLEEQIRAERATHRKNR